MFSVTQELRFCYGHRLLEHPGRCGRLRARGMVTDFEVHPTAENIAKMIFDQALRAGLPVALVEVVEQQGSVASYAP